LVTIHFGGAIISTIIAMVLLSANECQYTVVEPPVGAEIKIFKNAQSIMINGEQYYESTVFTIRQLLKMTVQRLRNCG